MRRTNALELRRPAAIGSVQVRPRPYTSGVRFSLARILVLAPVLVGCGATTSSPPSALPIASSAPSAHPGDGVPDPNGRIAFGRVVRNDSFYGLVVSIWAIDPDGSDLVELKAGDSTYPAWSPDGTRLAFTQLQPDGTWQIATMAADGTDVRVLTTGDGAGEAAWSPDSTWIAYSRQTTPATDPNFRTILWRMDADGSNPRPLGDQAAFDIEPRISPDGAQVLFERLSFPNGEQRQELVVRDIATGEERDGAGK